MRILFLAMFMVMLSTAPGVAVEEPDTYRTSRYRAAVPETLRGATVIDTATAYELWKDKTAVFVDVDGSAVPWVEDFQQWLLGVPHENIPNSHWLVNVGQGTPKMFIIDYFRQNLSIISGGDPRTKLVFYCRVDCWLGWNAAKRALEYGYINVLWYPDGIDGWSDAGHPLTEASPIPLK